MKRTLPVLAAAVLAVAACKPPALVAPSSDAAAPPSAQSNDANAGAASSDASSAAAGAAAASRAAAPQAPMLAMAYKLGLVVPPDQVRPLMESHQEACERAGPDQCQVLGANASADGDQRVSADLTLRATPAWMRVFRTRAEADAKDLGGRIDEAAAEGEDLSASIVDTEAAQRARAAERARLTQLMQRKTKDLDQTLQVEQAITQVQSDMDQQASELAAMKGRIAMQTVQVSYASPAVVGPKGVTAPLAAASHSFVGNAIAVLAALISLASFLLPFALIGAPLAWWLARRKKAPAAAKTAG
jgi:hypothetical protein